MLALSRFDVCRGGRLANAAIIAALLGACTPPSYGEYARLLPDRVEAGTGTLDASEGIGAGGASSGEDGGDAGTDTFVVALVHRYSFSGEGTNVSDTIGGADGTVVNAALKGDGTLVLTGGASDQYVDLPNGLASSLGDATFEAWITWAGGDPWQRVFDFGSSSQGEGLQGSGVDYVYLTPSASDHHVHGTCRTASTDGEVIASASSIPASEPVQIVLVVDDTHDMISLYWQGVFRTAVAFSGHLSEIHDFNDWLGRSQFGDGSFAGIFDEFRIYSAALTVEQIKASYDAGPNPSFLP